jgi:hypothetical protein
LTRDLTQVPPQTHSIEFQLLQRAIASRYCRSDQLIELFVEDDARFESAVRTPAKLTASISD